MVVNRAESVVGETVQDWVEKNVKIHPQRDTVLSKSEFASARIGFDIGRLGFYQRNGIVHRIDKETSGVLLVAKTPEAFAELQRQFKGREVKKTYLALVHGRMELASGVINAPVGRLPWNRERFGVLPGGRGAVTSYKAIKLLSYEADDYSLVEFYPKTGRTHQIRVHAKYLHHPLVGDSFYAGRKTARRDRQWCPRLFLHAAKISFTHPVTRERVVVESSLPSDLAGALNTLLH